MRSKSFTGNIFLHNTSTTYKSLLFISNINISYTTLAQPKIITDNIILRFTHSTSFLLNLRKMISRIYTYTTLNLFQHYHSTLKSYNLILTTIIQLDFRIFYLHNLKFLPTIALFTILVQPLSLDQYKLIYVFYICATLNFYLYGNMTCFMLHSDFLIFMAY